MRQIINRFKEPSTYASIGVFLGLIGINLDEEIAKYLVSAGMAVAGLAGIVMKEGNK